MRVHRNVCRAVAFPNTDLFLGLPGFSPGNRGLSQIWSICYRFLQFLSLFILPSAILAAPTFMGFGGEFGGAFPTDLSADGKVAVGFWQSELRGTEPFRWTEAGGMQSLRGDGFYGSGGLNVSADGAVVIGTSFTPSGVGAFRWTAVDGMQGLGGFPSDPLYAIVSAQGLSADGKTAVGWSTLGSSSEAWRWTQDGGVQGLGMQTGGSFLQASGVSANGQVVVGFGSGAWGYGPVRWTADGGLQNLGMPLGGQASAVSADGLTVVGSAWLSSGQQAFRWTADDGVQNLGAPNQTSIATGVSADGQTVVGYRFLGTGPTSTDAFVWDADHGTRSLKDFLQHDYGLNLTGWALEDAIISDDGLSIAGYGTNPSGRREAWLARLGNTSPEPIVSPSPAPTSGEAIFPTSWDPAIPTVVVTHGWENKDDRSKPLEEGVKWAFDMKDAIGDRANVIIWGWKDAFTKDLNLFTETSPTSLGEDVKSILAPQLRLAAAAVADQGKQLAKKLVELAHDFGEGILDDLHFVGHSLGTLVNAYAVNDLTSSGKTIAQFTILDRPFGNGGGADILFDSASTTDISVAGFDLDGPMFRTLLPIGAVKFVDNYYGDASVIASLLLRHAPPTGAPLYLTNALNQLIPGADHNTIHDWYQCSVMEFNLSESLCSPYQDSRFRGDGGYYWVRDHPEAAQWSPLDPFSPTTSDDLFNHPDAWLKHNCDVNLRIVFDEMNCREGSPAYLWQNAFHIPDNALYLSFEIKWSNLGDGDWLGLLFGDQRLFSFLGDTASVDEWFNSGLIPLAGLGGKTDQLLFALNSVGERNAEFSIRNLRILSSPDQSVPEPESLLLVLTSLGLGWILRRSRRMEKNRKTGRGEGRKEE